MPDLYSRCVAHMIADGNMHIDLVSWIVSPAIAHCSESDCQHVRVVHQSVPDCDTVKVRRQARLNIPSRALPIKFIAVISRAAFLCRQANLEMATLVFTVARGKQGCGPAQQRWTISSMVSTLLRKNPDSSRQHSPSVEGCSLLHHCVRKPRACRILALQLHTHSRKRSIETWRIESSTPCTPSMRSSLPATPII